MAKVFTFDKNSPPPDLYDEVNRLQTFGFPITSVETAKIVVNKVERSAASLKKGRGFFSKLIGFLRMNLIFGDKGLHMFISLPAVRGYTFEVDEKEMVLWCKPPSGSHKV